MPIYEGLCGGHRICVAQSRRRWYAWKLAAHGAVRRDREKTQRIPRRPRSVRALSKCHLLIFVGPRVRAMETLNGWVFSVEHFFDLSSCNWTSWGKCWNILNIPYSNLSINSNASLVIQCSYSIHDMFPIACIGKLRISIQTHIVRTHDIQNEQVIELTQLLLYS